MKVLHGLVFLYLFAACLCQHRDAYLNNQSCLHSSLHIDEDDDPHVHGLKCDSIYVNLLCARAKHENNFLASAFVREFFETARCDDVFNMTYHRRKYVAKIIMGDRKIIFRILNFTSDTTDESIVSQAY
jgi:hypothetical protein